MDTYPNLTTWKHYRITTTQRDLGALICGRQYRAAYRRCMPFLTRTKLTIRRSPGHRTIFVWTNSNSHQPLLLLDMRPFNNNEFEVTLRLADRVIDPFATLEAMLLTILETP